MAAQRRNLEGSLRARLAQGPFRMGEVRVTPRGAGADLWHFEDETGGEAEVFTDPHDALAIARYDDAGVYRPLKTAPNLRRGWRLELAAPGDVMLALDFLYPALWGTALAWRRGELVPVNLRETLARQSGMYAVVRKIDDTQAEELVSNLCRGTPGCLRRILWKIAPGDAGSEGPEVPRDEDEIPLLCAEACNLLVAAGRKKIKEAAR